jgi:hypothetical protein
MSGFASCCQTFISHTDTQHQPVKTGKKMGKVTQQIQPFFHTHQGVSMWNEQEGVEGVSMTITHFSVIIFTARFISHLNGITK